MKNFTPFRFTLIACTLILLSLAGCSRTQIIYNFSDWFIVSRIDKYFQLTSPQQIFLEKELNNLLTWHRSHELPEIVNTLSEFQNRYQNGLDPEDLDWIKEDHHNYFKRFFIQAALAFSQFLTTLQDDQIEHFKIEIESSNEFLIKQLDMTDEDMVDDTHEWFLGILEDWFGTLHPGQISQIKNWIKVEREWIILKLENRRNFQKEIYTLLRSSKSPAEIEAQLVQWIEQPETRWPPEFRIKLEQKIEEWNQILLKIDSILTPPQRDWALDKIQDYIDDFRQLALTN